MFVLTISKPSSDILTSFDFDSDFLLSPLCFLLYKIQFICIMLFMIVFRSCTDLAWPCVAWWRSQTKVPIARDDVNVWSTNVYAINVSTERFKVRPMVRQMRESTLPQTVYVRVVSDTVKWFSFVWPKWCCVFWRYVDSRYPSVEPNVTSKCPTDGSSIPQYVKVEPKMMPVHFIWFQSYLFAIFSGQNYCLRIKEQLLYKTQCLPTNQRINRVYTVSMKFQCQIAVQ